MDKSPEQFIDELNQVISDLLNNDQQHITLEQDILLNKRYFDIIKRSKLLRIK